MLNSRLVGLGSSTPREDEDVVSFDGGSPIRAAEQKDEDPAVKAGRRSVSGLDTGLFGKTGVPKTGANISQASAASNLPPKAVAANKSAIGRTKRGGKLL